MKSSFKGKRSLLRGGIAVLGMSVTVSAMAACLTNIQGSLTSQPYALNVTDGTLGQCAGVSAATVTGFLDSVKAASLNTYFTGVNTTTDAFSVDAAFNSLFVQLSFPGASTALSFIVPGLGINQTFTGATRDASMDLLADYLKKNNVLGQIMNYQAKNSPFSTITGQGGLIPMTLSSDFNSSFTDVATNIAAPASTASAASKNGNTSGLIGLGLGYTSGTIVNTNVSVVTLPLSYTFRGDSDPRKQLILQLPITYVDLNGAKTLHAGLGGALRLPLTDQWTITPGLKFSVTGSADMATVAGLWSGSLTSTYVIPMSGFDLAIGNMLGYYKTAKFTAGDYSFDPNIKSVGLRNGVMLSQPVSLLGSKLSLEYSFIDTRYFGDKPFADNSQEIGVTIGTNKNAFASSSFFRAGINYTRARESNTVGLNLGYWF